MIVRPPGQAHWLRHVRSNPDGFASAPTHIQEDREVAEAAVSFYPNMLQHASEELRADASFVLKTLKREGSCLRHAAVTLRGDVSFMMEAIDECGGQSMRHAAEDLKSNRQFS